MKFFLLSYISQTTVFLIHVPGARYMAVSKTASLLSSRPQQEEPIYLEAFLNLDHAVYFVSFLVPGAMS